MHKRPPKILVVGIDAATFDLILPWIKEGKLPIFKELIEKGSWCPLDTVPNLNSAAAWPSFATGKHPANHGIICFYEHKKNSYDIRLLNGSDIDGKTFWEILSEAGKRVGIINVPMTYPAKKVNGFIIAGMDTPTEQSEGFAYPSNLYLKLIAEVKEYYIDANTPAFARGGKWDRAIQVTEKVVNCRLKAALHLMEKFDCDVFVVVFTALDRVQHCFWKFMDKNHPEYNPDEAKKYGDVIYRFYTRMDEALSELIKRVDEDTYIIICSDHGAGFDTKAYLFLDPWLEKLGLLKYAHTNAKYMGRIFQNILSNILKKIVTFNDRFLSRSIRKRILKVFPHAKIKRMLHQSQVDWSKTKAYSEYAWPHIWINLKGREPKGTVNPGKEYEELREYIIQQLKKCRDIKTKKPIVKNVFKREEVYSGPYAFRAPDLIIDWNYETVVSGFEYEDDQGNIVQITKTKELLERKGLSGDHRPQGVLIISGKGIKSGYKLSKAHIVDIAPTILYLFGQEIPDDMDGKVLMEAFDEHYLKTHPIKYKRTIKESTKRVSYAADEERQIEDRLKKLGYL